MSADDPAPRKHEPKSRLLQTVGAKSTTRTWGMDPGLYDAAAVEQTVRRVGFLFGEHSYFRLSTTGWEHVPAAPAMLVMNHSGGTTIPDAWGFGVAWYRHFGFDRPLHPLAHEIILATDATGRYFSERGILRADRRVTAEALSKWRRDVLVMPGGDLDTWRPYSERWKVRFGGRTGFARIALETGVPIVPMAHAGAHETLMVLVDGHRIARMLGLKQFARAGIFPIHLSLPWGLAIGPLPHIPIPAHLRYNIGPAIEPPRVLAPGEAPREGEVEALASRVESEVQRLLDELARRA